MQHDTDGKGSKAPAAAQSGVGAPLSSHGRHVWSALELLGSHREAIIEYAGQKYLLRLTSNNKLILTK
jgi:hemin uptake protein HemP